MGQVRAIAPPAVQVDQRPVDLTGGLPDAHASLQDQLGVGLQTFGGVQVRQRAWESVQRRLDARMQQARIAAVSHQCHDALGDRLGTVIVPQRAKELCVGQEVLDEVAGPGQVSRSGIPLAIRQGQLCLEIVRGQFPVRGA